MTRRVGCAILLLRGSRVEGRKAHRMTKTILKTGRMTGTVYEFPRQVKDLDREWDEWWASQGHEVTPAEELVVPVKAQAPGANKPVDPERAARYAEAVEYIKGYTGTFGLILDLRADQRFGTKWFRLSDRQIEVVLASKQREARWADERIVKEQAPSKQAADGFYNVDGAIYKVVKAVHGSGHPYAKRLNTERGGWEYAPGMVKTLRPEQMLTLEEATRFGRLYGICVICGAPLTDEKSIEAGIGPICRGKAFGS